MIDLDRLKAQLLNSGLQIQNPALYQVINFLINAVKDLQKETNTQISTAGGIISGIEGRKFLTHDNEIIGLPNSRQLIAGTNITFDDTMVGQRTINASGGGAGTFFDLLTDGDEEEPELIFADGDVVWLEYA